MKHSITLLQIGKKGMTPEFIEQVRRIMEDKKAVKISFLQSSTRDRKQAKKWADELILGLGINFKYDMIGWTLIVKKIRKKSQKI